MTKKNPHLYYERVLMEENGTEMVTCELMWKFFCKSSRSIKMLNMCQWVGLTVPYIDFTGLSWPRYLECLLFRTLIQSSDLFQRELPYIYKTAEDETITETIEVWGDIAARREHCGYTAHNLLHHDTTLLHQACKTPHLKSAYKNVRCVTIL